MNLMVGIVGSMNTSVVGAGGGTNGVHFVTMPRRQLLAVNIVIGVVVADSFVDATHTCRTSAFI